MARPDPRLLDPARYPYRSALQPRYQDLDPNGHINNVAAAALFEDVRVRFQLDLGVSLTPAGDALRTMIVSLGITYIGEMFYPGPIAASIGVLAIGRTSWTLVSLLCQDGRPAALMESTIVGTVNSRPVAMPDGLRAGLEAALIRLDTAAPAA